MTSILKDSIKGIKSFAELEKKNPVRKSTYVILLVGERMGGKEVAELLEDGEGETLRLSNKEDIQDFYFSPAWHSALLINLNTLEVEEIIENGV